MENDNNPENYENIYLEMNRYFDNQEELNEPRVRLHQETLARLEGEPARLRFRDKVDVALTGLAVGFLAYEAATPLPEESARITLGIAYGLGAAAFRGYILPRLESWSNGLKSANKK